MAKQANQDQPSRAVRAHTYFGKVCAKHPGHNGERYFSNSTCLGCTRTRNTTTKNSRGNLLEAVAIIEALLRGENAHRIAKEFVDRYNGTS